MVGQVRQCLGPSWSIVTCDSADSLRKAVQEDRPDIAVMDILLNGDNGITLTQELFPRGCGTAVIFVTGFVEYCTDVYEAEHVYFLQKPVQPDLLRRALKRACETAAPRSESFSVRVGSATHKLNLSDVTYIESFYRKLRIHTRSGELECYGTLNGLPANIRDRLIRTHKSFLVNPEEIRVIQGHDLLLRDDSRIPISRTYLDNVRNRFLDFCAAQLKISS